MIRKPVLLDALSSNRSIADCVIEAIHTDSDIENLCFEQDALENITSRVLDFSGCLFRRVHFSQVHATRIYFSNCRFEQCDFSGMRFRDGLFGRVEWIDCRGVGSSWDRMKIRDALFSDCQFNYLNLTECQLERVEFQGCDMTNSTLFSTKQKELSLENCRLNAMELNETRLKNVDLTTCELEGLIAQTEALRDATISVAQAPLILGIYGIRVRL